jgi:hypothetical protein
MAYRSPLNDYPYSVGAVMALFAIACLVSAVVTGAALGYVFAALGAFLAVVNVRQGYRKRHLGQ